MNWRVVGQLLSITTILLAGPAVVVLLALNKGNL
jgi:hypothetical protein